MSNFPHYLQAFEGACSEEDKQALVGCVGTVDEVSAAHRTAAIRLEGWPEHPVWFAHDCLEPVVEDAR